MGKQIVLANDEPDIRRLIGDLLRFHGFELRTAEDGESCVRLLEESLPDLVILDLWMPKMTGAEVLAEIRANFGDLPVLVVSAAADREMVSGLLQQGANEYLVKPFEGYELVQMVRNLVGRR